MARTKLNQRSADRAAVPTEATGGRTPPSKSSIALLVTSIITALWAAAMLTPYGRIAYYFFFIYSEFYMGVITLVSLSITIMLGLVATDRLVLSIRQRVLLQSAHRTTGMIAVTTLVVHVWTKTIEQHIRAIDIVVPFVAPYNTLFVGLGTVSGWVMVLVMWTGIARARFIGGKPWMWRSVHAVSYLMWPVALIHGLAAGRAAPTWVIVSYVVCVLFVLVGLAVRLSVSLTRRKDFSSTSTGSIKPVGSLVPTGSPIAERAPRRGEPEPVAAQTWVPATPVSPAVPPMRPTPVSPALMSSHEAVVGAARPRSAERPDRYDEPTRPISRRALEDDRSYAGEPAPRSRPRVEEPEPAPRPRRAPIDAVPLTAARRSRGDADDYRPRRADGHRYAGDDEPRGRRYADQDEPRGRRYADEGEPRGHRYAEGTEPAPRSRRELGGTIDHADSGRHSRSQLVDPAPPADRWRGTADPNYMEPDDTPTLVDIASRRARKQQAPQDTGRAARRGARRGRGRSTEDALDDQQYWRQIRGEAQ